MYNTLLADYKLPDINTCRAISKDYLLGLFLEPPKYKRWDKSIPKSKINSHNVSSIEIAKYIEEYLASN